jgi:hypothetical protein
MFNTGLNSREELLLLLLITVMFCLAVLIRSSARLRLQVGRLVKQLRHTESGPSGSSPEDTQ